MADVHPDIANLRHLVDTVDERRLRSDLQAIRKYIKTVLAAENARAEITHEQEDTPRRRPWTMTELWPDFTSVRGGIHFPSPEEADRAAEVKRQLEARRAPLYAAIRYVIRLSVTKTLDQIDDATIGHIQHLFSEVPVSTGWREETINDG